MGQATSSVATFAAGQYLPPSFVLGLVERYTWPIAQSVSILSRYFGIVCISTRREEAMSTNEMDAREFFSRIRTGKVEDDERLMIYTQGLMNGYHLQPPAPEPPAEKPTNPPTESVAC